MIIFKVVINSNKFKHYYFDHQIQYLELTMNIIIKVDWKSQQLFLYVFYPLYIKNLDIVK